MLQPYADAYWALQRQRATNNTFVPAVQDYQGTAAYLLGMGYFQKLDAFTAQNQQFHKVQGLVNFQSGLGTIGAAASATNMQAKVDMIVNGEVILGNGSLRPDSQTPSFSALENYYTLEIVAGSAQEHNIIQRMFKDQDARMSIRGMRYFLTRGYRSVPDRRFVMFCDFFLVIQVLVLASFAYFVISTVLFYVQLALRR